MTTYLSPLSPAFSPSMGFEQVGICICNDGMPSLCPANVHEEVSILSGIDDDALDEYFPPTAEEAAEIEEAEEFVITMASLALLEEREEHARANFGALLPKRWKARRQQGLVGKPRPAHQRPAQETKAHDSKTVHETRLVSHEHRHKDLALAGYVSRERARADRLHHPTKLPKQKRAHYRMPIQQPSKFN